MGVHIGGGWFVKEQTLTAPAPLTLINESNYSGSGILGGGQVGINYQMGPWVIGAEAQFSGADLDARAGCGIASILNCRTNVDFIGTIAARFGFADGPGANLSYEVVGRAGNLERFKAKIADWNRDSR